MGLELQVSTQRRILVIDHSEAVRETTRVALEEGGHSVATLSSPAILPALLRKERFDLVLVDDAMPSLGTKAILETARSIQGDACPLVLFSDRPEGELRRLVADWKANGFVRKTHDPQALLREVEARIAGTAAESTEVALLVAQPTVRLILEEYLRKVGCEPFTLAAEGCVEEIVRRQPLAAFLDLDATPTSGETCCQRIKEHPLARATPVALLTANASAEQVMRCWRAGSDDCLPLPMSAAVLAAKVAALRAARSSSRSGPPPRQHSVLVCLGRREESLSALLADNGFPPLVARSRSSAADLLRRTGSRVVAAIVDLNLAGPDPAGLARELAGEDARPVLFVADGPLDPAAAPNLPEGSVLDLQRPLETVMNRLNRVLAGTIRNPGMERVPFFSRVDFRVPGERAWQAGFAYDLSLIGIFVRTLTPLKRGTELELEVDYGGKKQPVRGLVAWMNPFGQRTSYAYPPGMGIHLSGLTPDLARHVKQLVQRRPPESPASASEP